MRVFLFQYLITESFSPLKGFIRYTCPYVSGKKEYHYGLCKYLPFRLSVVCPKEFFHDIIIQGGMAPLIISVEDEDDEGPELTSAPSRLPSILVE